MSDTAASDRVYFKQLLSGRDFAQGDMMARQMVNFAYLIGDRETGEAVVVDPAYNVADLLIISCTPLFLLAAGYQGVRTRLAAARNAARPARGRTRTRILALASTGLIVVVTLGAVKDGGVNAAPRHAAPKTTHVHPVPGRVPPPAGVPVYAPPAHSTG